MRPLLKTWLARFLAIGFAICQLAPSAIAEATPLNPNFQSCVNREAKNAFRHSVESKGELAVYGYPVDAENEVISRCDPSLPPESLQDSAYTPNPSYKYINTIVETQQKAFSYEKIRKEMAAERRQAEIDAPRLKSEKEEEDAALAAYYHCLVQHAQELSKISTEPAETIAQASYPECFNEKKSTIDISSRHKNGRFNYESMSVTDGYFKSRLINEIIKARARPLSSLQPPG
ncbi:hypothetical protein [Beijerinckia sp. L45]|uniref:hypothetical protein n=1 Tax=Beijerinckia sp. L45 TaxID=1641855 RepID=UPI00131B504D|nr:hypothetical protein [Beijerinckia sp. L45]